MNDDSQLEAITKRLDQMQREMDRLSAVVEIQNIMGRYEVLLAPQTMDRVAPETFALWMDDVSMEVSGFGVFVGKDALKALFTVLMGPMNEPSLDGRPDLRGAMYMHHINTPMIEVAMDGLTAHAVWFSSGVETPFNKEKGKRQAKWCWGKYAADLLKGERGWKIWHLHWFRGFMNDYYSSWADEYETNPQFSAACERFDSVRPTTYHMPYSPEREMLPVPCCPDPYQTHTGSDWPLGDWVKAAEK
jgi:hypothetical protein